MKISKVLFVLVEEIPEPFPVIQLFHRDIVNVATIAIKPKGVQSVFHYRIAVNFHRMKFSAKIHFFRNSQPMSLLFLFHHPSCTAVFVSNRLNSTSTLSP